MSASVVYFSENETEDQSDTETEIVAAGNLEPPPVTAPITSRELQQSSYYTIDRV